MSTIAWTLFKEHGWVTANYIKTANTQNTSSFSTRRVQLSAQSCHRQHLQDGNKRQSHSSPRSINSSLTWIWHTWAGAVQLDRHFQSLLEQEVPDLRICPNTPKGKANYPNNPYISLWPQDIMAPQSESVKVPQLLCWFAVMLLLYSPLDLWSMPYPRLRYGLLCQGVKGRIFPLIPLPSCQIVWWTAP